MKKILIAIITLLTIHASHAASRKLFNPVLSDSTLSITTTNILNHTYPIAGIKILSKGYRIENSGVACKLLENGFCMFSVSNTTPASIIISGSTGNLVFQLCLNAKGPLSCQNYQLPFVSPSPRFAYIGNFLANNDLIKCDVNAATGAMSACAPTGSGFASPDGITFNSAQTIAYVTNYLNSTVSQCSVNAITGELTDCINAGATLLNGPDSIVINPAQTRAYIVNFDGNNVIQCNINPGTGALNSCQDSSGSIFNGTQVIFLNAAGTIAYVADFFNVYKCAVNSITGALQSCTSTGSGFDFPAGIALNAANTLAYVANFNNSTISVCVVSVSGELSNCNTTSQAGIANPSTLALNRAGTILYVPNVSVNTVLQCRINQGSGAIDACVDSGATGFQAANGFALYY